MSILAKTASQPKCVSASSGLMLTTTNAGGLEVLAKDGGEARGGVELRLAAGPVDDDAGHAERIGFRGQADAVIGVRSLFEVDVELEHGAFADGPALAEAGMEQEPADVC